MPGKRKRTNATLSDEFDLPTTLREVNNLSNINLSDLLRQFGIPCQGKRLHRITLLANRLHIQTSGSVSADPFLQTLHEVKILQEGWTDDIRQVPEVKLEYIINYLLASHDISGNKANHSEDYSEKSLKSYKALRSYDWWESGHISSVSFNPLTNINCYSAVKCKENPSGDTSGTQYDVIVILQESGKPIGASCTCVAGLGEACTHIAGLLFGIEDFVSRGYKLLPVNSASTEKRT